MSYNSALAMNLASVNRVDNKINSIIQNGGQVCVYQYEDEWKTMDIEGNLFVCARTEEPYFVIVVLNRKSVENFVEYMTPGIPVQIDESFVIYNRIEEDKELVFGLWFYDQKKKTEFINFLKNLPASFAFSPNSEIDVSPSIDLQTPTKTQPVVNLPFPNSFPFGFPHHFNAHGIMSPGNDAHIGFPGPLMPNLMHAPELPKIVDIDVKKLLVLDDHLDGDEPPSPTSQSQRSKNSAQKEASNGTFQVDLSKIFPASPKDSLPVKSPSEQLKPATFSKIMSQSMNKEPSVENMLLTPQDLDQQPLTKDAFKNRLLWMIQNEPTFLNELYSQYLKDKR